MCIANFKKLIIENVPLSAKSSLILKHGKNIFIEMRVKCKVKI